jgi:hypothetical protein
MSNEPQPSPPPTQFGVFYPLGHVVLALQSREDAERIRQLLIDGGYDEREVIVWDSAQVATGARELQQSASILAKLFGAELDAMHKHIELADAGYTFLAAYSPSDLDTKRVMNGPADSGMPWRRSTNAFPSRSSRPATAVSPRPRAGRGIERECTRKRQTDV